MNIARPVASSIERIHFGPLSQEDVKNISVKRVFATITYDNLLNPVPGGLYDTALGAAPGRPCTTCHLDDQTCPGHYGHLELPTYVYHCAFMDQVYRLIRSQCLYCYRLRLSRVVVNRYICQLRLIHYGLINEASKLLELEDPGIPSSDEGPDAADSDDHVSNVIDKQLAFVAKHTKKLAKDPSSTYSADNEAVRVARRDVLERFKSDIGATLKCASCKGMSPKYRKNRSSGIFIKPLSDKAKDNNIKNGVSLPVSALQALNRAQLAEQKKAEKRQQKRALNQEADEGVADLETSSGEDMPDADVLNDLGPAASSDNSDYDMADGTTGSLLETESGLKQRSKSRKPDQADAAQESNNQEKYLDVNEARARLVKLFDLEAEVLSLVYPCNLSLSDTTSKGPSADMFFLRCLLVPPNKFRKETKTASDMVSEPPEHAVYKAIMNASQTVWQIQSELTKGVSERSGMPLRTFNDLQRACIELQDQVNALIDNTKSPVRGPAALNLPDGVKQKLERKEGLFRMYIMGKRVNFAARTVLSPDPNLETNEIGVPPVFARTLTYPEPATPHNFEELKLAVINGPEKWPGAAAIEYENGQVITLRRKNEEERTALANSLLAPSNSSMTGVRNKKVHRHLNNGDIVIMNRQPTLHKPSMMCHRAKVLRQEKTFRMHYANCKTYNADFDGDEMNLHFPQNEIARAEALQIADTDHQYLSATAGEPLRGLIQDHISISVWLTCADMFFTRQDYQELLYCSLRPEDGHTAVEKIQSIPPAILKPKRLWTGKQVITTILKNIKPPSHAPLYMAAPCSTSADVWIKPTEEGIFRIEDGELLTGIMDKKQIGPAKGGFIHNVYEAYGHVAAGRLMSTLGRLLTRMLNMRAFSCGVEDLILTNEGEQRRNEEIQKGEPVGLKVASKYVTLDSESPNADDPELLVRLEGVLRDDAKLAGLDTLMKGSTGDIDSALHKAILPKCLQKLFPRNQMQTMTGSGAKGSGVNAAQISSNLGQQSLEGRRVPVMVSGKTLPCFRPFDSNIRCGGYIYDRFLTGVRPQEYYFHTMSGREGLIDTAVKTARSGYLQRCLTKGMEGLRADYDTSVRDSDGTLVQTLYGEDGLETTRKTLMDFSFQAKNFLSMYASLNVRVDNGRSLSEEAMKWNAKALKKFAKNSDLAALDPVLAHFPPAANAGSVSEKFLAASRKYIQDNPDQKIKSKTCDKPGVIKKAVFEDMLRIHYLKSVVPAGEPVGVVAGQSIGEPSTQMTLNTFHLAGHSAANVTLGIPRLRDILMFARKTTPLPIMKLYPLPEISEEECETFVKSISRLSLAELIDYTKVEEILGDKKSPDARIYKVTLQFFPAAEYTKDHAISITEVADKLETVFVRRLDELIKKEFRKRGKSSAKGADDAMPEVGQSSGRIEEERPRAEAENEGGDSDLEDGGDDDATNAKQRANLDEGLTFEDPNEEEDEMIQEADKDGDSDADSEHEDEGYGGSEHSSPSSDSEAGSDVSSSGAASSKTRERQRDRENRLKNKIAKLDAFSFNEDEGKTCIVKFRYLATDPKILLLDIVKQAASNTLIHEVPGIKSCVVTKEKDKSNNDIPVIVAAGINLKAMQSHQDTIDPHTMSTNDIWGFHTQYGVEAGRNVIIKELNDVFKGHGIAVDHRHLILVADYMTRDGGFLPFNRQGMRSKRSAFAKMSFETTMAVLSDAALTGENEDMSSPSARITIGKLGRMGTGMCDVLLPT